MKKLISILIACMLLMSIGLSAAAEGSTPPSPPEGGMGGTPPDMPEGGMGGTPPDMPEGGMGGTPPDMPEGGTSGNARRILQRRPDLYSSRRDYGI